MDQHERHVVDDLFARLRQAEERSGPRDREAEDLIRRHVGAQPAAPYYLAQVIVVQEQALAASQARVQELERQLAGRPAAGGGGFLAGLFGGGGGSGEREPAAGSGSAGAASAGTAGAARIPPHYQRGGGGFLAGAMQTAVGVAGGVLIGNALAGLFAPDEAAAAEPVPGESADAGWGEDAAYDEPTFGGDDGGSFLDDAEF